MGNQLTGIAPSQIFPVDHYLTDVTDYEFDASLGSTRFFKVARAKYKEGLAVVKVFAIHDPSLPLKSYKDQLEEMKVRLHNASNCLPFLRSTLSDKSALLFREYVRNNLYDRISTRPFLNVIEKKWIAFQLLCAVNQAHHVKVCHGDIKSENVMVTGWNWVLLTDFASFKPTYLPADDPADFSFFFDTSRRRTCYLAPERFIEGSTRQSESATTEGESIIDAGVVKKGERTPQMDIFSVGCVIAELFTEGHAPFDLSQLLAYCSGTYSPASVLNKIEDPSIKSLVEHMLQKDPSKRLSADDYLLQWKHTAFPEVFYTYLKIFIGEFAGLPILPSDEKIARLKVNMSKTIEVICPPDKSKDSNGELIIVLSLVTSCLRTLKFCISKLAALEILLNISRYITDDVILERVVPCALNFVNDAFPRVRAEAIRTLSQTLALVHSVPRSDANIFPEYILPNLSLIAQDDIVLVRVAYAENIASLAETALRFLEMVQLDHTSTTIQDLREDSVQDPNIQHQASYDDELQNLHGIIQQKVVTLLSDPENIVKQTLLENGITQLCVFFGRQKANDILLSHMITFLNDKNDWHLRGSFFDSIVGVAAYVGWQSSFILKPLIQQGLCDSEEFVICKALTALMSLIELGLLQKPIILDLASEIAPNLCHPNLWIRQKTVGVISVIASNFNIADVHCNLIPLLQPFIKQSIIQVDKEAILLNAIKSPVPRQVFDYILRTPLIESFFDNLQDRQLLRNLCRPGHQPSYNQPDDNGLAQLLRKLQSQGMTEEDEDKLLLLKDAMLKQQRAKSSPNDQPPLSPGLDNPNTPGIINILALERRYPLQKYHADLLKPADLKSDISEKAAKKIKKKPSGIDPNLMNEEWKSMFGTTGTSKAKVPQVTTPVQPAQEALSTLNVGTDKPPGSPVGDQPPLGLAHRGLSTLGPISMSQLQAAADGLQLEKKPVARPESRPPPIQTLVATCKLDLSRLVALKREQYTADVTRRTLIETAALETKLPASSWKPRGLLVAHLHEHKAAINRIQVSQDHAFFATCSNDGTVKVWDTSRLLGKSNTNRSRQTYNRQQGSIRALTFCQSSHSVATASDDGSIYVNRIETNTPRFSLLNKKQLDLDEEGFAVDITHFETGSQSVVAYATVQGYLFGWDLRAPGIAWKLRNEPSLGLVTSFVVDPQQCWLAVGTSNGAHTCWDLRFQLPITTVHHPTGSRVRRITLHPNHPSWIISTVQGNNEVSMWDMETGARQFTLWASPSPPLSQTQTSNHAIHGLYCIPSSEHSPSILTGGSDQRLRYWSLTNHETSGIVAGSVSDPPQTQPAVVYKRRLIDGTEVIIETINKHQSTTVMDSGRPSSEQVPVGHCSTITDLGVFVLSPTTAAVATASQDGVVKIWK